MVFIRECDNTGKLVAPANALERCQLWDEDFIYISSTDNEDDVVLEPCFPGDKVFTYRPPGSTDKNFYFYEDVMQTLWVGVPFMDFEADVLTYLNVAPFQLQPNNWGFVRSFELLYGHVYEGAGGENFPAVLYNEDGSCRFPICWTQEPVPIRGYDPSKLSDTEKDVVEIVDVFQVMMLRDLLNYVDDAVSLQRIATLILKERTSLSAKAKALCGKGDGVAKSDPSRIIFRS
ncbi:unnamed protein product [Vicia faba]|uniref:Uncharacterized protein n=1 Tax=Vicia faba TaxID=3906 RepID=A0AAV1B5L5_VICFA|nr:unnamed protein product [Vicia faba]